MPKGKIRTLLSFLSSFTKISFFLHLPPLFLCLTPFLLFLFFIALSFFNKIHFYRFLGADFDRLVKYRGLICAEDVEFYVLVAGDFAGVVRAVVKTSSSLPPTHTDHSPH